VTALRRLLAGLLVLAQVNLAWASAASRSGDTHLLAPSLTGTASWPAAGLVSGVNTLVFGADAPTLASTLAPGGGGLTALNGTALINSIGETLVDAPIKAGVNSLLTGADFGKGLVSALRTNLAAGIVSPVLMSEAGDLGLAFYGSDEDAAGSPLELLLHAGAGALGGLISGGPKGALGELALDVPGLVTDPDGTAQPRAAGLSQILGGLGSLLARDPSMAGADAALAGFAFNYLSHSEILQLKQATDQCFQGDQAACRLAASLNQKDMQLDAQLHAACAASDSAPGCVAAHADLRADARTLTGNNQGLTPEQYHWIQLYQRSEGDTLADPSGVKRDALALVWSFLMLSGPGRGTMEKAAGLGAATAPEGGAATLTTTIDTKIAGQIASIGWTTASIDETIASPVATSPTFNRATGNPATACYATDGSYIVRDNVTGKVAQISDKFDPTWKPDVSITNPYTPPKK
jgi:filamentous hemagglutinin